MNSSSAQGFEWLVVRVVWGILSLTLFGFVGTYQSDIPWGDEYDIVPIITGHQPLTARWLWSQHNEHRVPLPRLAQLGILYTTGNDFRAGTWVIATVLSGLALGGIWVAELVRRRSSLTDVFFPFIGLYWGQVENLLWNWQLQFIISLLLTAIVLAIIVLHGKDLSYRYGLAIGTCLVLLPLCGGNGLLMAVPLAIWLAGQAMLGGSLFQSDRPQKPILFLGIAITVLILCGIYFVGLKRQPLPNSITVRDQAKVALEFLAISFGPDLWGFWKISAFAMASLLLAIGGIITWAAIRLPGEWQRATGLASLLLSFPITVLLVGYARAGDGSDAGLQSRYSTLWLPAWWVMNYAVLLYVPGASGRIISVGLTACAALIFLGNLSFGQEWGERFRDRRTELTRDLDAGLPAFALAQRYYQHPFGLCTYSSAKLNDWLIMLRENQVGRFARITPNPIYRTVSIDPTFCVEGTDFVQCHLPPGLVIYAVQFSVKTTGTEKEYERVTVTWNNGLTAGSEAFVIPRNIESEHTTWIGIPIEEIRWNIPPQTTAIRISQISLFVPPNAVPMLSNWSSKP